MLYLDFFSGSHGHFLEYVINTWLFKGPRVKNIFTKDGACHGIRSSNEYMAQRRIQAAHYTEFGIPLQQPSKIVRIDINQYWAKWIYQINVTARAGDIPLEKKIEQVPEHVRMIPNKFRNDWYSKLNFNENNYNLPGNWVCEHIPSFNFAMESVFDHVSFYAELYHLADFLEITFVPDQELFNLLTEFLEKNQGWQQYLTCKKLVKQALSGQSANFSSDELSQALINSFLSITVGIFDGELFDSNKYPTNTLEIWQLVTEHLQTFDQRF
jgi:hypothetical protein